MKYDGNTVLRLYPDGTYEIFVRKFGPPQDPRLLDVFELIPPRAMILSLDFASGVKQQRRMNNE